MERESAARKLAAEQANAAAMPKSPEEKNLEAENQFFSEGQQQDSAATAENNSAERLDPEMKNTGTDALTSGDLSLADWDTFSEDEINRAIENVSNQAMHATGTEKEQLENRKNELARQLDIRGSVSMKEVKQDMDLSESAESSSDALSKKEFRQAMKDGAASTSSDENAESLTPGQFASAMAEGARMASAPETDHEAPVSANAHDLITSIPLDESYKAILLEDNAFMNRLSQLPELTPNAVQTAAVEEMDTVDAEQKARGLFGRLFSRGASKLAKEKQRALQDLAEAMTQKSIKAPRPSEALNTKYTAR